MNYFWFFSTFRSESPVSDTSSPPISPGCEDQQMHHGMHLHSDPFKKPLPPQMHQQGFPPFYSYPPHILAQAGSAFHRPVDASGKPIIVS